MSASQLDYRVSSLHPRLSDWRDAGLQEIQTFPHILPFGPGEHDLSANRVTLSSGQVIRGAGEGITTFLLPSLYSRYGKSDKASSGNPYGYSWKYGWFECVPGAVDIGIEDCTIKFLSTVAAPHHAEKGYNAVFFKKARNASVRRVTMLNCDNGVLLEGCTNSLVEDVKVAHPDRTPNNEGQYGHYGVQCRLDTTRCLTKAVIDTVTHHDLSVERSSYNVFEDCSGRNLCLDHHRDNPHHNLWTDINVGLGTRVWKSGGNVLKGQHNGVGEVFWNLRKGDGTPITTLPPFGLTYWNRRLAIVGHTQNRLNADLSKEWVEGLTTVEPPNVYRAQRGEVVLPPPPPSTQFLVGRQVTATAQLNIRSEPRLASTKLGTQPTGAHGVVVESEVHDVVSGFWYVKVDFMSGVDGYCGTDRLS